MEGPRVLSILGSWSSEAASLISKSERVCVVRQFPTHNLLGEVEVRVGSEVYSISRRGSPSLPRLVSALYPECRLFLVLGDLGPAPRLVATADRSEALELIDEFTLALTGPREIEVRGLRYVPPGDLPLLLSSTPVYPAMINCGKCGLPTCLEYLKRAPELGLSCQAWSSVTLEVNGTRVPLVPFVERQIRELTLAFLRTLKGVPAEVREVSLRIVYGRDR